MLLMLRWTAVSLICLVSLSYITCDSKRKTRSTFQWLRNELHTANGRLNKERVLAIFGIIATDLVSYFFFVSSQIISVGMNLHPPVLLHQVHRNIILLFCYLLDAPEHENIV